MVKRIEASVGECWQGLFSFPFGKVGIAIIARNLYLAPRKEIRHATLPDHLDSVCLLINSVHK